jgi:hypothetical protein
MHTLVALIAALVVIVLSAQCRSAAGTKEKPVRDFAAIAIIAGLLTLYYCF